MNRLIKAEYIKGRRSFGRKSLVAFPLLVATMAIVLMGGQFSQIGAFNWWYMILLPTLMGLVCINLTEPEKRNGFFNVSVLPVAKGKIWLAKALAGCSYLLGANMVVFVLTAVSGSMFGAQYKLWQGLAAAFALTLACAWQIPLWMFISTRLSSVAALLGALIVNVLCSSQPMAGGRLWFVPFAIPARLMAPILGVNPNGVPMQPDSPLWDTGVILPGLLIASVLFVAVLYATGRWFNGRSD